MEVEFDGKALKDIAKGELDLGNNRGREAELEAAKTEHEGLLDRLKALLTVRSVRSDPRFV